MAAFETRLVKMITRFTLLLALSSLSSISANTDCGGMPFSCVNSTFFKICVDFGNGISRTVDDFVIPCPQGTECRPTNHYECEATPALFEKTTVTEKVATTSEVPNNTKYTDERSVVTPKWEELPSVNPHEVEFSEKYLDTANHVTLIDESLSTTNAVFDVMTEVTTESMVVNIRDIFPFETTTIKNIGVTSRNLKETVGDFFNPAKVATAYPGMNTEHPLAPTPKTIPTSEVISTTFSDVISTTEQYGVGDFSQVDDAETITTYSKVSNPNDNFVETTTLYDSGINELFYSTSAPISEKGSFETLTKTDQTGGPINPITPLNVLKTTVQNVGTEFVFTTEANDAYKTTLSLTPTDTITHDVPTVNAGVLNNKNLDFLVPGNIFENSPATTETNTVVTFDTLLTSATPAESTTDSVFTVVTFDTLLTSATPAESTTDSVLSSDYSEVTSTEASTEFPKDTQNPNEINFKETSSNAFENKLEQKSIIQTTTTKTEVSNANEKFVESTTLYATGLNDFVYSTPAPVSEKNSFEILTTTDQTEGSNDPTPPLNILETTVHNVGIEFAFTTESNDAYETTLSLTQTDAITHDMKMVNTGVLNNRNSDFTIQGIIFESTPATTESITAVTFDALATTPDDYAADSISKVTSDVFKLSIEIAKDTQKADGINFKEILSNAFENKPGEKPVTHHLGPNSMTDSIMASIIHGNKKTTEADSRAVNGNFPTITESITQVQETTRTIFNLEKNLIQQADGNSASASQMHNLNKQDNQTVVSAKDTPIETATEIQTEHDKLQPTTEVNGDNIPTESNKYSWNEQQNPTNIEQSPGLIDNVAITAKDQTSFNNKDSASKNTSSPVATQTITNNQQDSKLEINDISLFSISHAETSDIKTNKKNIEENKNHQFHSGSSQQTPDKISKPKIQQATNVDMATLTHIGNVPKESKTQSTQQTASKTDDTETHQIKADAATITPTPSFLNQYTATAVASTVATIRQVPAPITERDINKPTAPVQGMITESLLQTPSEVNDSTKLLENVNGATLGETKHLPGQDNVLGNHYSNMKQDGAFNAGSNDFSQTAPSSVTTSPWTETNIGVDESLLIEMTTANPLEKSLYTFSIPATNADATTSELTKGMIEPTDVTAPATVIIIENVNPTIAASTHEMVPENAVNTGATPVLHLTSPAENTVKPPTTSSSVQITHGEVRSETASVQPSDAPVEKPNDVQVADAIQTIHLISKPTGTEGKATSLTQPPVIRKEETIITSNINTVPTVSTNANENQQIVTANNVASLEIAGVIGADMIHSPNDLSTKPAVGKIQTLVNLRDVTATDDSYMSTKPANVIPNPGPPFSHQTSQSPVVQEVKAAEPSKDTVQNPSDKIDKNQEKDHELKIIKTINSVSNGKTLDSAKAEGITVLDTHNSQVLKISPKIISRKSPATQLVVDTSLMSTAVVESDNNAVHSNVGNVEGHTKSPPTIAATIGNPTTSSLLPLSTPKRVQVVTPTIAKNQVFNQIKAVTQESANGGNTNQEVNKSTVKTPTVTTASTPANKRTLAAPSASIGFNCSNLPRGRYSDKDDCRKFHICIDQQDPIVGYCPNNTVFSEIKKQCTKNLSHCVRGNEFQCVSSGRYSDYLLKNIYYICVKNHHSFYRFKFQCQTGFYLNKMLVRCMPNIEGSVESISLDDVSKKDSDRRRSTSNTMSTSTTTERILRKTKKPKESKSSTTTERSRRKNRDECEEVGKYPHPEDCRKYYVCYKTSRSQLRQRRKKCDSDEVFHKDKRKCVDAESYECDL